MLGALLNFHSDVRIILKIFCEPDSREVSPPELLNNHVSIKEDFANMYWMVTSNLVVGHSLVLAGVLVLEKALTNLVFKRSEIFLWKFILCEVLLLFERS